MFDANGRPIASSGSDGSPSGSIDALRAGSHPPVDVGLNWLDEEKVADIVQGCIDAEGRGVSFEYALYLSRLASQAPLETASLLYGAALEALRDSYLDKGSGATLVPSTTWRKLSKAMKQALTSALESLPPTESVASDVTRRLSAKVDNLNAKSSGMRFPEFFAALELSVSPAETEALQERNRAAHGHKYTPDDHPRLNQSQRLLAIMFNRVTLKLGMKVHEYIDYATEGHPTRELCTRDEVAAPADADEDAR
jgi:hypothetical protein